MARVRLIGSLCLVISLISCASGIVRESERVAFSIQDPSLRLFAESTDGQRLIRDFAKVSADTQRRQPASNISAPHVLKTAIDAQPGEVAVYVENREIQYIPGASIYQIFSNTDSDEIARLQAFILKNATALGLSTDSVIDLHPATVLNSNSRIAVRFKQYWVRHNGERFSYSIPLDASGVVAILDKGKLVSITSTLAEPPSLAFIHSHPGIDLSALSSNEFAIFLSYLSHPTDAAKIANDFARLSNDSPAGQSAFNYSEFLKSDPTRQRQLLSNFTSQLGPISTRQILVELARKKRLSLVRRAENWMLQVTGIFDLPLQFDVELPRHDDDALRARNLRLLRQDVSISIYDGSNFPHGPFPVLQKIDSESPTAAAGASSFTANLFKNVAGYYKRHHGWLGTAGTDPNGSVDVYVNITDPLIVDNAAWVRQYAQIWIGAGGAILQNQKNSASILSHEFTHAVVDNSSGLVYEGESGAINEHFADIQGSMISSELSRRAFDFEIGNDAINPAAAAPRQALLNLLLPQLKLTPQQITKFSLDRLAVRHLLFPELSFATSYPDVKSAANAFGADCQPSVDNDQCGVHSWSGIPNRAVATIINKLGSDRMRDVIYNTVVLRLGQHSSFQEYLRQLYEECLASPGLDAETDCPVIIESFASVGIDYPNGSAPAQTSAAPKDPQNPTPLPQNPNAPQSTPELVFGGWVSISQSSNITIIDNKYDTAILVKNYSTLTKGDYSLLQSAKCARVAGHISQIQNAKGTWFNYFVDVTRVVQLQPSACNDIVFK